MKAIIFILLLILSGCGDVDSERDECVLTGGQVVEDENGNYAGCIEKRNG